MTTQQDSVDVERLRKVAHGFVASLTGEGSNGPGTLTINHDRLQRLIADYHTAIRRLSIEQGDQDGGSK